MNINLNNNVPKDFSLVNSFLANDCISPLTQKIINAVTGSGLMNAIIPPYFSSLVGRCYGLEPAEEVEAEEPQQAVEQNAQNTHEAPIRDEARIMSTHPLEGGGVVRALRTNADGSCGIHAMVGVPVAGSYRCNAEELRNGFCDWLRSRHSLGAEHLPSTIDNVLSDYFFHFDEAPPAFQRMVAPLRERYFAGYSGLSNAEKDLRTQMFIRDPEVFNAYLTHVGKVGTYLLQDELEAFALYLDKKVHLYQPGWGIDSHKVGCQLLNAGGQEEVHIWYNGENHYEKATVN
jgi:hypothetical protein